MTTESSLLSACKLRKMATKMDGSVKKGYESTRRIVWNIRISSHRAWERDEGKAVQWSRALSMYEHRTSRPSFLNLFV
ncbi:hypothetical protein EVAR_100928_1 [Eumeta japonica]|uniref:Uncharacterized protein n=1 Tax=Eumeta variegata TaxID=151549 RepID=A0A4C2ACD6_EUMVA|nr:hypothetical protein EVAR_100928_1 [Eumeta japonica]